MGGVRAARVHLEGDMRVLMIASALVLAASAGSASAAGCLTGAAVGAGAGHLAGHHAVLGGAAGCAIGHHHAKKVAHAQQQREQGAYQQGRSDAGAPPSSAHD
jgi:hypothetical protein